MQKNPVRHCERMQVKEGKCNKWCASGQCTWSDINKQVYYINNLPNVVDCDIKMFADTKAYSVVENPEMRDNLQSCIDDLTDWTDKWLLQFNNDKCKVLHVGKNNKCYLL